jgi:DNA polymerase
MRTLALDLETYSSVNLVKAGAYKYASSPDFEILLLAYAFDDEAINLVDIASGEEIPTEVIDALFDESIIKVAFNSGFERTCIASFLNMELKPTSWQCTAVQSAILGLPLSLQGVGEVLGLASQKMKEGKDLIKYFCVPCKATKTNGGRTRNMPSDHPEKWELFKKYCIRDVEVERAIREKLKKFPTPEKEQELYILDQEINDRGLRVDMDLVDKAIFCDRQFTVAATEKAYEVTGLENPNSVSQLKTWLKEQGVEVDSLSKKNVEELVGQTEGEVEEALKLRLLMAKTSVKKYEAIERAVCPDGRVHGLFQFYGANRTGRFAGRLVQFQNMPQNHIKDLELARTLVKEGCLEDIELLFGNVPKLLSELIRTAFIPNEGSRFIVADFSAIEARVIAWLANEKWRMEVFRTHGKIYGGC